MSQALQPRPGNAEIADRPARPLAGRPDSGADLPLVREVDVALAARAMRCLSWPLDSSKCLCEAPGTFERRCLKKQRLLGQNACARRLARFSGVSRAFLVDGDSYWTQGRTQRLCQLVSLSLVVLALGSGFFQPPRQRRSTP